MSQFTANPKLDPSTNPRDWAYELACLPTSASIVFTKDSFLAFLKTHNIDVSPNYTEINKLPRYAKIGTMSEGTGASQAAAPAAEVGQLAEKVASVSTAAQPRAAPAPPSQPAVQAPAPVAVAAPAPPAAAPINSVATLLAPESSPTPTSAPIRVITPDGQEFRPTRRVREPIGGGSALVAALFGSADGGDDFTAEAARESQRRRGLLQERTQQQEQPAAAAVPAAKERQPIKGQSSNDEDYEPASNPASENHFRPTRRVREPGGTGGSSSIALG